MQSSPSPSTTTDRMTMYFCSSNYPDKTMVDKFLFRVFANVSGQDDSGQVFVPSPLSVYPPGIVFRFISFHHHWLDVNNHDDWSTLLNHRCWALTKHIWSNHLDWSTLLKHGLRHTLGAWMKQSHGLKHTLEARIKAHSWSTDEAITRIKAHSWSTDEAITLIKAHTWSTD
jgi:hypothetical protein